MKNPEPNPVDILLHILQATGPSSISSPGLSSLTPLLYPAIFFDDGSGSLPYLVTGNAGDFKVSYENSSAFVGLNGLNVRTRVADAATGDWALATIHLPANVKPIIRVQLLFARPPATSTNYKTRVLLRADDETDYWDGSIEVYWQLPGIKYYMKENGTYAYTTIPGWLLQHENHAWHHLELAINIATGCYHEIKLDGKTYSIPTQPLHPAATQSRGPLLSLELRTEAIAAATAESHFAQILVTAEDA